MAIACPACGTENRSIAKFCIECIAPLPTEFAPTQVMAPSARAQVEMPSALAAFAAAGPSPMTSPAQMPMASGWAVSPAPPAPARQGIVMGAAIAALLLAGAIGWLAAGGDLWPRDEATQAAFPASDDHQRQATGVPKPALREGVDAEPTPVEALAPGESIVPVNAAPPPPGSAPVTSALPAAAATAAGVAKGTAKTERAQALLASCDGLGFISASRCRVDLCSQAANRQRKECRPILAQQQLMEEKRNPTLAH